jgi:hypothetical protein
VELDLEKDFPAIIEYEMDIETREKLPFNVTDGFMHQGRIPLDWYEYISPSRAKKLIQSGRHYWWKYIKGVQDKDTPSKILGRILHSALLEPGDFKKRFVVQPKFEGEGMKKRKEEWTKNLSSDALILNIDQATRITDMIESIQTNEECMNLLKTGFSEVLCFAKDKFLVDHNGDPVPWFSIIDFINTNPKIKKPIIVEVKSTRNPQEYAFKADALKFGYDLQTWINRRSFQLITGVQPEVVIIAIENVPPHNICVYPCNEIGWFDLAEPRIMKALDTYKHGMTSGIWTGYPAKVLTLPPWADMSEQEEEIF